MIPLPLGRIAEITGGALTGMADPHAEVRGPVVIDSRAAEPGALFVALKGERDGHDYVAAAFKAGAGAALVSRPVEGGPTLTVAHTQRGLEDLARAARACGATRAGSPT